MVALFQTARLESPGTIAVAINGQSGNPRGFARLIQVALAVYLLPALLIVLVVGVCGMLILAVARGLSASVEGFVRDPAGRAFSKSNHRPNN